MRTKGLPRGELSIHSIVRASMLAILACALMPARAALAAAPSVVRFSPQGTVKGVRQVTARFSAPMVPLGDRRVPVSPFDSNCPAKGTARWIDSFNWSFDFANDLPAGLRCTFTLHRGLKSLAGEAIAPAPPFTFDTGGPSIVETRPWSDSDDIDEQQAFLLILDTEVDPTSALQHASFSVSGIVQSVGVTLMQGANRDVLFKRFQTVIDKRPFVIIQARQSFPDQASVKLIWGAGIKSASGIATTSDQEIDYTVRKAFQAKVRCDRVSPNAACIPVTPITLHLTEPIGADAAKVIALVAPDGQRIAPKITDDNEVTDVQFEAPFKESTSYKIELPPNLTDIFGRALSNAAQFPMAVQTDQFPPLAKFSARFGIIEAPDPVLPITVRNLEAEIRGDELKVQAATGSRNQSELQRLVTRIEATFWRVPGPDPKTILDWLNRVALAKRTASVFADTDQVNGTTSFAIPKPNGPNAFEVMGIPLKQRGLYVVELKSERLGAVLLGDSKPMYVPTAALVTNLAVHFKLGKANSLVWVTELETGRPVKGADVKIADCNGTVLWSGHTDGRGLALVPQIDAINHPPSCDTGNAQPGAKYDTEQVTALQNLSSGVLVTARRGEDFSFVHSSWKFGIENWRFHVLTAWEETPYVAHTVFDRTLLRSGETIHMKHFIRTLTLDGFGLPEASMLPDTVSLQFSGSDQHYDFPLTWGADRTAETDWTIPRDAKLGEYDVMMSRKAVASPSPSSGDNGASSRAQVQSGSFQVQEFRIPLMKAAIKFPAASQIAVTQIPVDVSANYLSGGPARGLPVVLRGQISNTSYPSFPDYDGFTFANGPVKEGVQKFENFEGSPATETSPGVHQRKDLTLDTSGGARTDITDIPRASVAQDVRAEMEFHDPNGETQTVSNVVTVWPSKLLAGVRIDDWTSEPGIVRAKLAAVDDTGKPAAHVPIHAIVLSSKFYSYRKRLIGGFYAYENSREVKRVGELCAGVTDDRGMFYCEGKPGFTGEAVVQVSVADAANRVSIANTSSYIEGANRMWFPGQDEDRMDVIAEEPEYVPGDTARFQVRMPFESATALVTVEREGIIAASVMKLSTKNPVVALPVRDYAPNVYVSVLAVRGRIASIQPTAMVDLGKPAFRLGVTGIRVGWRSHRLQVTVIPGKLVYHVREKAHVTVKVRAPDGSVPPAGTNVALAAVDQGLLELKPNESWKLIDAMMDQRPYQVHTSAAEMEVVGRRHFGLKAIPPGGGGGRAITRELFDTLLLWNANVPLDANGDAKVDVPLNDSLTSFKIVAIAAAGSGEFGTGDAMIRSTQDLQLFSGLSPIARVGDSFAAEFTVRNASDRTFDVNLSGAIEGLKSNPAPQKLSLAPGDGKKIDWNVAVPLGVSALKYRVDALASATADHLLITQQIIPAVPVRTWQATLVQLDKPLTQPVAMPSDALAGQGGVQVRLSPALTAGLGGIEVWMRAYPYVCMEQRVSRAIALEDPDLWKGIIADLPSYTDSDGLLKYFPTMQQGSDVLTSYVLAISNEAGLKIPGDSLSTLQSALNDFVAGKLTRDEPFAVVDLPMRKLAALEALARYGKVEPAVLSSVQIDPKLWPDSSVIDWWSILERTPAIPDRAQRLDDVWRIMLARLNAQGTAMHLSSDPRNDLWWLMVSPAGNMVRLVLVALDANRWHDDLPKIMQGALAMQQRGAWPGTISNAWGTLAVKKFAAAFESTPVTGLTTATLGASMDQLDWAHDRRGGTLDFMWPPAPTNLALAHGGTGSPWAQIRTSAAIPLKTPFTSGYTITKTITPVDSTHTGGWKQGDLARVHLKVDAQTDMTWVVVDDPIPAGASHLGIGFARESQIATSGENENNQSWVWPAYTERAFSGLHAYYSYVPKGPFEIDYTIRLNQIGTFQLPPTHVQAIYEPEMLGELPNAPFTVSP